MSLKPCPFCGGEAETWAVTSVVRVACSICHVDAPPALDEDGDHQGPAWNRRVPDRDALVRAVLRQQWAAAVAMLHGDEWDDTADNGSGDMVACVGPTYLCCLDNERLSRLAALPCAADVVADMLGDA